MRGSDPAGPTASKPKRTPTFPPSWSQDGGFLWAMHKGRGQGGGFMALLPV